MQPPLTAIGFGNWFLDIGPGLASLRERAMVQAVMAFYGGGGKSRIQKKKKKKKND